VTNRLLTLTEAAHFLHVSPQTVRGLVRTGRMSPVRICRRILFRPEDLERFVREAQQ
jgi:excisionase family DNA binding protein